MAKYISKSALQDVMTVRTAALAAAFTAMVFTATFLLAMSIPASQGYFNLGEAFVYLAALIGGPYVGAIAGGFGAALADALLAPIYIPATLLLKGLEGFAAGVIFHFSQKMNRKSRLTTLFVLSVLIVVIPVYITTPSLNGIAGSDVITIMEISLPGILLVIIALILCVILWISSFLLDEKGNIAITCVLSGMIIIVGYFLYAGYLYGIEAAIAEIPFNVLQVLIGSFIAIPVYSYLQELGIIEVRSEDINEDDGMN